MATLPYGYQGTIDGDLAARREGLVLAHLPQVRLIAKRIHDRLPHYVSLDDLVSAGVVGLLNAIDNFDPGLNVQLNTYAEHRIRGAIMDGLREMDWAPREIRQKSKLVENVIRTAQQRVGREPTEEEIASLLKISVSEYQRWLTELQHIELERLEYASGDNRSGNLLQVIGDDEESWPSAIVERSELERRLAEAIDRMPKTERTVLSLYYYEEMTLREIAEIMGIHLSRVGQLRAQAVLRLRCHFQKIWLSVPRRKT